MIRRVECGILRIPLQKKTAQPTGAMADELDIKDRVAPIIVERRGWCARHLPAGQGGAGFTLCAVTQQDRGGAAFSRRESQPPAGHQVQTFGRAMDFQLPIVSSSASAARARR